MCIEEEKTFCTGSPSLSMIREQNSYFIDKTDLIYKMLKEYQAVLFTRPRRFGKSLLVDVLANLFRVNRDLFIGTAIEPLWDWEKKRAVFRFDFSRGNTEVSGGVKTTIISGIQINALVHGFEIDRTLPLAEQLALLIFLVIKYIKKIQYY